MTASAQAGPILARRAVISAGQARSVLGSDVRPGDVLATGVVLEVSRNDIDGEARLEMPGADIHYVDYDETVLVLASVDRELLDGISLGTFVARAETRRPALRAVAATPGPVEATASPDPVATDQTGEREKQNRGRLGDFEPHVQHYTDTCPIHGETTFALHRAGARRDGSQRLNRRCLKCHSDYNLAHRQEER